MVVNKSYSPAIIDYQVHEVDLSRDYILSGNLFIPVERGLNIRCYPYDNYWFMMDNEVIHVQSKQDYDILVNKFTLKFALERL